MLTRGRLGTFLAVLLGTAVVTIFLVLLTSGQPRVPDRLDGFSVLVQSPATANRPDEFSEPMPWSDEQARTLVARLRSVPGVDAAVLDRTFYAQPVLDGRPVASSTSGHEWFGAEPLRPGDVILGAEFGVPVGSSVTLLTATGPAEWKVSGHTRLRGIHFSGVDAARLGPGVRVIGLSGAPDHDLVRAAVGSAGTVLIGHDRGLAEPRSDARTRWIGMQVLIATTALAGFACVFLVTSTSAYAVNQQRREIGLLRAVGATPQQVRRALHLSALKLGAQASLAGVVVGAVSAIPMARVLVDNGLEPHGFAVHWQPWVLAVAFAAGPLVALAGSAMAARRASRVSPIEALRVAAVEERAMSRARWIAGLVAVAGAAWAGVAAATAGDMQDFGTLTLLGAMALITAAALLAPAVMPALVRLLLAPLTGVIAVLARESARTAIRRTASTAVPVLFTVAFAVFVTGTVQTSAAAFATKRADDVPGSVVLVPDGTPGLHDAVAGPAPLDTTVYLGRPGAGAAAFDAAGAASLARDTVLLSASAAKSVGVSSLLTVTFRDGLSETLRVTTVAPDGVGGVRPAGGATFAVDVVVARDLVREHDPSALAPAVIPAPPGAAGVGARAAGPGDLVRQEDAEDDRLVEVFTMLLLVVSAGAGALAVANTLLMTARRRKPDYRALRLTGASSGQVVRAVALESTLVVVIGALLGGAAGAVAVVGSARSLGAQIGVEVPVLISWPAVGAAVTACIVLALSAAVIPAARSSR